MSFRLAKEFLRTAENEGIGSAITSGANFVIRRGRLFSLRIRAGGWRTVREINGSEMELHFHPNGADKIDRQLALNGIREAETTLTIQRVLERFNEETTPVHVFDVGANVGYYTLLEANVLGESGRIYAIEAEPRNAERLEKNIQLNGYSNIEVIQAAAGAERTKQELSVRSGANVHRMSTIIEDKKPIKQVEVDVYSVDYLIREREIPDDEQIVVRIDVEGYEPFVFDGMSELFESDRPVYIMVEIHPNREHFEVEDIVRPLVEHGFTPEYVSLDGGDTVRESDTFEDILGIGRTSILMASRVETD